MMPLIFKVVSWATILSFIVAFAAHIQLQFCIDRERVRKETGHEGLKILGSILAPIEFYKEEAASMWKIRNKGLKIFALCVGMVATIAVVAAILEVPLG